MSAGDTGLGDAPSPGDEGEAFANFKSTDMFIAIVELADLAYAAASALPPLGPAIRSILQRLEGDLTQLATETAAKSVILIRDVLDGGMLRPVNQSAQSHLRDAIVSTPAPYGAVKIGIIAELNKVVNRESGYGPYWRAIEYGSVATGNIMTGRVLFGSFVGPGHDDAPRAVYRGGGGPGAEFLMGDATGGFGTIEHEIQPRHFLQQGTDYAEISYAFGIRDLSRKYARELLALIAQ